MFRTEFANGNTQLEAVSLSPEAGGWKVTSYYID